MKGNMINGPLERGVLKFSEPPKLKESRVIRAG